MKVKNPLSRYFIRICTPEVPSRTSADKPRGVILSSIAPFMLGVPHFWPALRERDSRKLKVEA
jgi:hypothetical protein